MNLKICFLVIVAALIGSETYAQRFPNSRGRNNRYKSRSQVDGLDYGIGQNLTSNEAFSYQAETWASVGSNKELRPLLSYSNEWGRYTQYKMGEFGLAGKATYTHRFPDKRFGFVASVAGQVSTDNKRTMFNEAFIDFDLWMAELKIGLEQYTPIETNSDINIGSYVMSNNAHAVPRAWLGVLDYWAPLTLIGSRGFQAEYAFDLRFGLSLGRLDDDMDETVTDDIMFHEKFFYFRVSQWFIKPYIGAYHSAMLGGVMPDASKTPRDFGATFFGHNGSTEKFSDPSYHSETVTPAGGNQGFWDLGIDFETPYGIGHLFYQRPHADGQKRKMFGKDFTLGLNFKVDNLPALEEVTLEFMSTKWQGGEGMNVPCVPNRDGEYTYVYFDQMTADDIANLRAKVLVVDDFKAWESEHGEISNADDLKAFIRETYNGGNDFGGRVQYLDDYYYKQGWTRRGLSMGNSLMHTARTVKAYASDGSMQYLSAFPNTRVVAFNIGAKGNIIPRRLDYVFRTTISKNYGNYNEQYVAPDSSAYSSGTKFDNYFFDKGKLEVYTKIGGVYDLGNGLKINGNISFDLGNLYSSFSLRAGVGYYFNKDNVSRYTSNRNRAANKRKIVSKRPSHSLSQFNRGR